MPWPFSAKDRQRAEAVPASYLPAVDGIPDQLRRGRNPHDGYVRAWGIQHGELRSRVRADPVYAEAWELAKGRTIVTEDNRINLFLLLRFFVKSLPFGHVVEFGSYRGGNAIFMAAVARRLLPGVRVYALDTFRGMPATEKSIDAHSIGDFGDVDLDELRRFVGQARLDNLELVPGLFQDTAPALLARAGPVALAHVDCDIYSAVACAYDVVKPHLVDGAYVVFDDALTSTCLGATEAVEELVIRRDGLHAEQVFPQLVFRSFAARHA